ncbi:MAG: hypothetical protein SGI90_09805 [Candidatus Eisenbacteria bacterium]|nr:hypothetical protein [Candidatus Eisenbacteria bacterium]
MRLPSIRRGLATAALTFPLLALLFSGAAAAWTPQYFVFDRMAWSPDGKSLGVIGRYWNRVNGESFEDTLTVDPATGAITCVSPSALEISVSRDGNRILTRGRWGLYDHDLVTGKTRLLMSQHPFQPIQIVHFAYDREVSAAMVIRCNDWDGSVNGVYRLPLDTGEPVRMRADEGCGAPLLNYFQTHSRGLSAVRREQPGRGRPVSPERFPGTIWQLEIEGLPSVAVWGNAEAGSDTLCLDCRPEFLAWPQGGGPILMATCPVDIKNVMSPGQLWLIRPGQEARNLGTGRFDACVWADSSRAFVTSRPSALEQVDARTGAMNHVGLSMTPPWLSNRILPVPHVWTVRLAGEIHTLADSASAAFRAASPILGGTKGTGWSLLRQPDPKRFEITIGSFDDSTGAAGLAKKFAAAGFRSGAVTGYEVLRRPIHDMLGEFQFGSIQSPDGAWRAWFKTHPHLVQPYMSSELWIEPKGGRPRPVLEGMASF